MLLKTSWGEVPLSIPGRPRGAQDIGDETGHLHATHNNDDGIDGDAHGAMVRMG